MAHGKAAPRRARTEKWRCSALSVSASISSRTRAPCVPRRARQALRRRSATKARRDRRPAGAPRGHATHRERGLMRKLRVRAALRVRRGQHGGGGAGEVLHAAARACQASTPL